MNLQTYMVSADRCMNILDVPQERVFEGKDPLAMRTEWPESGRLEFKNVSLRYRPNTEVVLH